MSGSPVAGLQATVPKIEPGQLDCEMWTDGFTRLAPDTCESGTILLSRSDLSCLVPDDCVSCGLIARATVSDCRMSTHSARSTEELCHSWLVSPRQIMDPE